MRLFFATIFLLSFLTMYSQVGVGLGYNIGYNVGRYSGIDNTVNCNLIYKQVEFKANGGAQQHGKFGMKYKYGATFGFNKIIEGRIMFDGLWGVRFITIDGQDPFAKLGDDNGSGGNISLMHESGIYFRLLKNRGIFAGLNTFLIFSEYYTDTYTGQYYRNPNVSFFFSLSYLFLKKDI